LKLKLEKVVPWGRSFSEYIRMFDLKPNELKLKILDCGGGPASFNAEMTNQGNNVISCDPIYEFGAMEIARRIDEVYPTIIANAEANRDSFVWTEFESPSQLGQIRMAAMQQFLADFPVGVKEGRYLTHQLPLLPFETGEFDLALCSHLLFTYSDQLSETFHLEAIREMCRVAKEARIFPLLVNFSGEPSVHLQPVMNKLVQEGYQIEVKQVNYEFQRGGNQLLSIKSPSLEVLSAEC